MSPFAAILAKVFSANAAVRATKATIATVAIACDDVPGMAGAHCRGDAFSERQSQLNTWFLSFLSMEWMNREATALICRKCGQVIWFSQKPVKARRGA